MLSTNLTPINCGYYCDCVTSKASGSKDSRVIIWNVRTGHCEVTLSGHTDSVESVLWGGEGLLYSGSRDCKIKVCCVLLSPIFLTMIKSRTCHPQGLECRWKGW